MTSCNMASTLQINTKGKESWDLTYVFNNTNKTYDSSLLNMILFGSQNISLWNKYI